jgi:hypothetical protein
MTHTREQSGASGVRAFIRQHSTTTFFLFTFLITWAVWVPNILAPDSFVGTLAACWTYMPAVAAVIVAAIAGSLRDLLKWLLAAAVAVSWLRQVPAGNRRRLAGAR